MKTNASLQGDEKYFSPFYQEKEMQARYVEAHRYISDRSAVIQLHSHPFHELLYCRSGQNVEYVVGAKRYFLQKGDLVLIPAGVSHRPLLGNAEDEPYERETLWLSREFFDMLAGRYAFARELCERGGHLLRTAGTKWEALGAYFERGLTESEEQRDGWELSLVGAAFQLLPLVYRALHDSEAVSLPSERSEPIDGVIRYVEKNLCEKLTLGGVAKRFYVSESTLSHTFRARMGVSFYRVVTQYRLIEAKRLLLDGQAIEEISRRVGFEDYSAFYRAFRREYGVSPSAYRRLFLR